MADPRRDLTAAYQLLDEETQGGSDSLTAHARLQDAERFFIDLQAAFDSYYTGFPHDLLNMESRLRDLTGKNEARE